MASPDRSPRAGCRFPPEWAPQEAVWLAWPARDDLWPGRLGEVRERIIEVCAIATRFQTVRVLCPAELHATVRAAVEAEGGRTGRLELFDYWTDDVWARDFGPVFLFGPSGELRLADWRYNAWGGKFERFARDDAAAAWIAERLGAPRRRFEFVLEGGAVESNGAGAILTTEAVLLNPNRNGPVAREAVEARLRDGLGAEAVVWLGQGLVGDDTDGHVDNLARFVAEDAVLAAAPSGPDDPNRGVLEENERRLRAARTARGERLRLERLPLPEPVLIDAGRAAASYLNFVVLNGAVLAPVFGQSVNDARALEIIGRAFPGRQIFGIDCRAILAEGGALHCLSQNQPRAGG